MKERKIKRIMLFLFSDIIRCIKQFTFSFSLDALVKRYITRRYRELFYFNRKEEEEEEQVVGGGDGSWYIKVEKNVGDLGVSRGATKGIGKRNGKDGLNVAGGGGCKSKNRIAIFPAIRGQL